MQKMNRNIFFFMIFTPNLSIPNPLNPELSALRHQLSALRHAQT
jgi:hypothetical protein